MGANGGKDDAPLEVVIVNGGFGEDYANAQEALDKENFPKAEIKCSVVTEISETLQPRFVGGNPPGVIDGSGVGQIDPGSLVAQGQLAELAVRP
jgi:N-acetylglucosamine transport system substrate-binding protein